MGAFWRYVHEKHPELGITVISATNMNQFPSETSITRQLLAMRRGDTQLSLGDELAPAFRRWYHKVTQITSKNDCAEFNEAWELLDKLLEEIQND
jgi:hypothetical protein